MGRPVARQTAPQDVVLARRGLVAEEISARAGPEFRLCMKGAQASPEVTARRADVLDGAHQVRDFEDCSRFRQGGNRCRGETAGRASCG